MHIALMIFPVVLISVGIGVVLTYLMMVKGIFANISGTLKIDSSDPDGPYLFLELEEDVNIVKQRKYAILEVDMSGYVSQK